MPFLADLVAETSNTAGVGSLNLNGPKSARYRAFGAGVGYATVCYYMAMHQTSGQWERGIGSVTAGAPDVLTRTAVLDGSSGAGVKTNFAAGTIDVFIDIPATRALVPDPSTSVTALLAGLKFPASQVPSADANTLDDYEKGSWTPSVGGSATYTVNNAGRYIKVGKLVYVWGLLEIGAIGTGSVITISGLPFVAANAGFNGCSVGYFSSLASAVVMLVPRIDNGGSSVTVTSIGAASTSVGGGNVFANNTRLDFTALYEATA